MIKTEERLEYGQLLDEFLLGCKAEQKVGMEYERIPVSLYGKNIIPYEGDFGMCEFLREFACVLKRYEKDYNGIAAYLGGDNFAILMPDDESRSSIRILYSW